jgi:hypothetical protein
MVIFFISQRQLKTFKSVNQMRTNIEFGAPMINATDFCVFFHFPPKQRAPVLSF